MSDTGYIQGTSMWYTYRVPVCCNAHSRVYIWDQYTHGVLVCGMQVLSSNYYICVHISQALACLHILLLTNITTYVSSHYDMCAQKYKRLENGGAAGPRKGEVRFVFPLSPVRLCCWGGILFCIYNNVSNHM